MPTIALEGTGVSIEFSASGFSGDLISLTLSERARQTIETTHLGTTGHKTSKPGETVDLGSITVIVDHNPGELNLIGYPSESITIAYPLRAGQVQPDQITLYGYISHQGSQEMAMDLRMVTKLEVVLTSAADGAQANSSAEVVAWAPSALGPHIWLDATDPATLTTSSGEVTTWADISGNARDFAGGVSNGGANPTLSTINGKTFVDCGAMVGSATGQFLVSKLYGSQFANRVFALVIESSNGGGHIFGYNNSVYDWPMHRGGASSGATASDPILSSGNAATRWKSGICRLNGSVVDFTSNGLSGGVDILVMKSDGVYFDALMNAINCDRSFRSGGAKFGEIINWSDSVTLGTSDFEKIEGYLAHKFGIASKLPDAHPYKSAPP